MGKIKELVIISGKGGTGKTTLTASLIPYFSENGVVIADCDVDAPDLHILLEPTQISKEDFSGLKAPLIDKEKCIKCGKCSTHCKFNAINENIDFNQKKCEGCAVCELVCPVGAIKMIDRKVGEVFLADTKYGKLSHARLIPGEETSGKLVGKVRNNAKDLAKKENIEQIIIDGAPGIACNVISSVVGANKVVIVTEPTLSGLHDLIRVKDMLSKFQISPIIVINKYNINEDKALEIEKYCEEESLELGLKIPFNKKFVEAVVNKQIPSIYAKEIFDEIGFNEFIDKLKD